MTHMTSVPGKRHYPSKAAAGFRYDPHHFEELSPPVHFYSFHEDFPVKSLEISMPKNGKSYALATLVELHETEIIDPQQINKLQSCTLEASLNGLTAILVLPESYFVDDLGLCSNRMLNTEYTPFHWHPQHSVEHGEHYSLVAHTPNAMPPAKFLTNLMQYAAYGRQGRRQFDVDTFYSDLETKIKMDLPRNGLKVKY